MLSLFHGPEGAAAYQAVLNLLGICHPVIFSIGNLIVPSVGRARAADGAAIALRAAGRIAVQGAVVLLPFMLLLALFPGSALTWCTDPPRRMLTSSRPSDWV